MSRRSLFVAGLQGAGVPNDPAATLDQLERQVRMLASMLDGVQLVVAPELHLMALPPLLEDEEPAEERAVRIPSGCRFHPRCPLAIDECSSTDPGLRDLVGATPGHQAAYILLPARA